MRKLIICAFMALILVTVLAVPAVAVEDNLTASVTVSEVISVTIADAGSDGINFGSLDLGTTDNPDVLQSTSNSSTPAVTLTMGSENNVSCNVSIKGTDFHTTIPVGSAKWAEGAFDATKYALTDTFALVKGDVAASGTVNIWHFIDIPSDAAGGTFQSTFTYQTIPSTP